MSIILYSTGCPKCNVLKKTLSDRNIQFTEVNSVDEMQRLGFKEAPKLSVDEKIYNFKDAIAWARQNGGI